MTRLLVLYVDDDPDIRTIVKLALSLDKAMHVRLAASGEQGLTILASDPLPDVVLLDVMMPGIDGPAMLDRIRADPRTASVPVIFITAKGRNADVAAYRDKGAIGTILKPFDPIRLASDVRALLMTHRAA